MGYMQSYFTVCLNLPKNEKINKFYNLKQIRKKREEKSMCHQDGSACKCTCPIIPEDLIQFPRTYMSSDHHTHAVECIGKDKRMYIYAKAFKKNTGGKGPYLIKEEGLPHFP